MTLNENFPITTPKLPNNSHSNLFLIRTMVVHNSFIEVNNICLCVPTLYFYFSSNVIWALWPARYISRCIFTSPYGITCLCVYTCKLVSVELVIEIRKCQRISLFDIAQRLREYRSGILYWIHGGGVSFLLT